jgi:ABC-2 type transport system permease protein
MTLPIIPLASASIIVMIVMGFTNIGKHKDQFKILGGLIAIGFSIGLYIFIQDDLASFQSLSSIENIIALGNHSLVNLSSTLFPTTNLLTYALLKETLLENLYLLMKVQFYNLITYIAFVIIGQLIYFKGVLGISETASKNQILSHKQMIQQTRKLPIQITYMLKEVRKILRTPAYLLNCVLGNFLWLLLIGMSFFTTDAIGEQVQQATQMLKITNTDQIIVFGAFLFNRKVHY